MIVHTFGLLLHFLTRLAHHNCVFFKGSERFQAVVSALTSGKFYRLPLDKENPENPPPSPPKNKILPFPPRPGDKLSLAIQ